MAPKIILLLKGYVSSYNRGGRLVSGYNTASHRQTDPRQGELFGPLPPQRRVVSIKSPAEHLKTYFEGDHLAGRRPGRVHAVLDGANRVRHWTTGGRVHAEDWANRHLASDDHPNRAVVRVGAEDWKRGKGDASAVMHAARDAETKRIAAIPTEDVDWKSVPKNPTHLVMRDWNGRGTTLAYRDASGSLHGIRDVREAPGGHSAVDAWVQDALDRGLSIDDQRRRDD